MQRRHLIELEDLGWWPSTFRDGCTEYLESIGAAVKPYEGVAPRLAAAIQKCQAVDVLDLCSGAGGLWAYLHPALQAHGCRVRVLLSDKFPNLPAFSRVTSEVPSASSVPYSVDAADVPPTLQGFRTLFTAFHHLAPRNAKKVLSAAVNDKQGIAVFEFTERSLRSILTTLLTPVAVLLLTPFVRPFRWSRLLWTYVLPVLPFAILFDGFVSCLRTYSPQELISMANEIDSKTYEWESGVDRAPETNIPITYLIGVPRTSRDADIPARSAPACPGENQSSICMST